jgi:hypothetical protein
MGEVVSILKNQRKTDKEYDYFRELKKKELGDNYPPDHDYGANHWSVEQFQEQLRSHYNDKALKFDLRLKREDILSPAYIALSNDARALYTMCRNCTSWEKVKYDKRNGGRGLRNEGTPRSFMLPYNLVFAYGGFKSRQKIKKSFDELKALGFIIQIGEAKMGEANIYKLDTRFMKLTLDEVTDITASFKEGKN